jgi:hypothetical protein
VTVRGLLADPQGGRVEAAEPTELGPGRQRHPVRLCVAAAAGLRPAQVGREPLTDLAGELAALAAAQDPKLSRIPFVFVPLLHKST